jgi:hypothetical protein
MMALLCHTRPLSVLKVQVVMMRASALAGRRQCTSMKGVVSIRTRRAEKNRAPIRVK